MMAQRLTTLATLMEDLGSVGSTYMAAHNHLYLQVQGIQHPFLASLGMCMGTQTHKINTSYSKKKKAELRFKHRSAYYKVILFSITHI